MRVNLKLLNPKHRTLIETLQVPDVKGFGEPLVVLPTLQSLHSGVPFTLWTQKASR